MNSVDKNHITILRKVTRQIEIHGMKSFNQDDAWKMCIAVSLSIGAFISGKPIKKIRK